MSKRDQKVGTPLKERLRIVCARCNVYIASTPCYLCGSEYGKREGA